jgi:glutathione synthase/RimK-type ligase-like ATP-grasp enzyme
VEKAREWRVTVVGNNIFLAAIYTDESAKDDWRWHQNTSAVRFRKEVLPDDIAHLCIFYLKMMGLAFGAFDLVEEPNGRIFFLECNPNGQYGWLEEDLGLPISQAIAVELIRIAKRRG